MGVARGYWSFSCRRLLFEVGVTGCLISVVLHVSSVVRFMFPLCSDFDESAYGWNVVEALGFVGWKQLAGSGTANAAPDPDSIKGISLHQ